MILTRRTLLKQTAAVSLTSMAPAFLHAAPRIKSAIRREETVLRLGGMGDNFHMSWAADDRQYVSVCDGYGWIEKPEGILYNSRLFALSGMPREARFSDVSGYPIFQPEFEANSSRYYNFGTLALDGRIYQFLSTWNHALLRPDGSAWPDLRFIGAKLIYSPDNGRTWRNQDGSTPVVWESWERRSRETMAFFEEPQESFSLISVLQMGRNYEANRDGYVYLYAPNGNTEGTMNELVMARVPKRRILDRAAYEFFAGRRSDGHPSWTKDINARGIVHTFPKGWVNKTEHPFAWTPSVVYNAPLGLYMMVSSGNATAPDGNWFAKPSYLGFWTAAHPWGPWEQIHEETAWMPAHDPKARAFAPQISPKWIAEDGKSFWLVWSDYQGEAERGRAMEARSAELQQANPAARAGIILQAFRQHQPYYAFNCQRVDLTVA